MRFLLSTICALGLMGIVQSTFPNDLYYSHHPEELAKANKKNRIQNNAENRHRK